MSNPNKQLLEYNGKCTPEYYNQFFNPNICHVCKSTNRNNLISCDQCDLVSYCSERHKLDHQTNHAKICAIIAQTLQVSPLRNMRKLRNRQQWFQARNYFMQEVQLNLKLKDSNDALEKYEKEMILWSKICIECFQQVGLKTCQRCFSVNYCAEHANAFYTKHHIAQCDQLLLLLNIDIGIMSGKTTNISYKFFQFVNKNSRCEEMLEFYLEYVLGNRISQIDWMVKDYIRSDYLSGPLTIYFTCVKLNVLQIIRQEYVIIHIIGAIPKDKLRLPAWEILFHLVPEIMILKIVMISPELKDKTYTYNLCNHCKERRKQFHCNTFPMVYNDFVECSPEYQKPNLIVGFHIKLYGDNVRTESTDIGIGLTCSLFLSFSRYETARDAIIQLSQVSNGRLRPALNEQNRFSGLAPHKDFEIGDIYYLNKHLVAYILSSTRT